MKKSILTFMAMGILLLYGGITVTAAPKTMPDGTLFDAEYYAQNNPDVVLSFGTDESLLFQHYVQYGKAEGRIPAVPALNNGKEIVAQEFFDEWTCLDYYIYTYQDGSKVRVRIFDPNDSPYKNLFDNKYIIPRTDFSDGLLDNDGNGIDDRDPYNGCGYTDLNFNCIADNAPALPPMKGCSGADETVIRVSSKCPHGVVGGEWELCINPECIAYRNAFEESLKYITFR